MNQASFNLIHRDSMSKLDVFVVWRTEFGRTQLDRRQRTQVGGADPLQVFIASAEDTILAKLDWYHRSGCVSDRQWRDVIGVLKVQSGRLDLAYLRDGAARLGLTNLLRRALVNAGLPTDE